MKMGTTRSPKFRRLSRMTGMSVRETVGTLELLWLFTMEQAPAGDIGKWPDDEIEEACDWPGEPGGLIAALVGSGWLDGCDEHRLIVHDWSDHIPEFLKLRVKRGSLTVVDRAVTRQRPDSDQSPTGRRSSAVDSHAMPSHAKPSRESEAPAALADTPSEAPPDPAVDPTPLLNLIANQDGERDEKAAWLEAEWPLIQAEAEADGNPKRVKPIAIRFYRNYLKSDRRFRNWAAKQETRRRIAEHEAKFAGVIEEIEREEGYAAAHR